MIKETLANQGNAERQVGNLSYKTSVVTARFITREVHTIARVEVLSSNGQIETLEGTTIHPVWSEDRQDFIPLGELLPNETLRASDGYATVISVTIFTTSIPVYNIEVHGEHVYQVGELGVLVHNAADDCFQAALNGGKHAGWLKTMMTRPASQIRKSIKSINGEIDKHVKALIDRKSKVPNFDSLDPRRQKALLEKIWPADIARQREQLEILESILRRMVQ